MRLSAVLIALGLSLVPVIAHADTQSCLNASEKGQKSRAAGKLRDAQKQFITCGDSSCPTVVRRDCQTWQGEIASIMPSVVFGAKDRAGRDLFEVLVTMDGEPLLRSLDGKSVQVDPGPHLFLFETSGQPGVTERVLVKEGEKARAVNVVFGPEPTTPPSKPIAVTEPPPPRHESPEERHHTVLPWIVVGLGGAAIVTGIAIVATRPSLPANCNSQTTQCTAVAGETNAQLDADKDQAGEHDSRLKVGIILASFGAAAAIGGLVWHFLEPTGPTTAWHITPWKTANGEGLGVLGTF